MNEPKPFASLGPSLLARKGAARPAMRPQLQPLQQFHEATARQLEEDLGWNDMGEEIQAAEPAVSPVVVPVQEAQVVSIAPAASLPVAPLKAVAVPEVRRQQEKVAATLVVAQEKPAAPALKSGPARKHEPVRRSALGEGRRAAFTLRLDSERHLKLRLACTLTGRSAQQLVTDALDQLVTSLPEVGSLAEQVRKRH